MLEWMVICMGTSNIYVGEAIRNALRETGVAMIHEGKDKDSFKIESAEGQICKERDYVSFLGDGGPLFSAEVETDIGKGKVRFIIPDRYLQALKDGTEFIGNPVHVDDNPRRAAKAVWN